MRKQNGALKDYFYLMNERPEEFADTGCIHIVNDENVIKEYSAKTGRSIGVVYKSPYSLMVVDLVYQNEGEYYTYERVLPAVKKGAIVVVPFIGNKMILLKQYRHALRDYQYSFPRGYGEYNLTPQENVYKELKEEIGAEARNIRYLGKCVADSGISGNKVDVFTCEVDSYREKDGYEGIKKVIIKSRDEIADMINHGELNDGFTLAALSFINNLQNL